MFSLRAALCGLVAAAQLAGPAVTGGGRTPSLADAQSLFYNAHYQEAADLALTLRNGTAQDLAVDEVRTTALLFVLRGLLKGQDANNGTDKDVVLKACVK